MKKLFAFFLISMSLSLLAQQSNLPDYLKMHAASKSFLASTQPKLANTVYELRSSVTCDGSYFYCEDFESVTAPNLPNSMNTTTLEANYFIPSNGSNVEVQGFYTGNSTDAGVGGYWTYLDEHTQFAMTNDDACLPNAAAPNENNNCDLSFEVLELPMFDFSQADTGMWLQFEFYHDKNWGGGDAIVEVSNDGGSTWNELSGNLPYEQDWQSAAYSLSDYNSQDSIVIRFVWSDDGSWASGFAVDDITVNPLPERAVRLDETYYLLPSSYNGGTTYKTIPLAQAEATGFTFGGVIQNMGLNTLDSARIYSGILSESFLTESYGKNTTSLTYDTLYCNNLFTASSMGQYTATYAAVDANMTSTDTLSESFMISEYDYALDNFDFSGGYQGGYYVNRAGTGQLGNIFNIYKDATLYGIKVRVHPNTSPTSVAKGVLYSVNGDLTSVFGGPDNNPPADPNAIFFLNETPEVSVGLHTDDWINFVFTNPYQLSAGDVVYAGVNASFTGQDTVILGYTGNSDVGTSLWQDIDGVTENGQANDWYYFDNAPMVRLNFDPMAQAPVAIDENQNVHFSIFPNPNTGQFIVEASSNEAKEATLSVKDILGKTIYSEQIQVSNWFSKNMDLRHLNKGVYFVHLSALHENDELIQKVIIH